MLKFLWPFVLRSTYENDVRTWQKSSAGWQETAERNMQNNAKLQRENAALKEEIKQVGVDRDEKTGKFVKRKLNL